MFAVKWKSKEFLLFVLFLQFIFYTTVFFDITVARQVLGFFYFTFLPGFIILKLLKLDELDKVETVLLSVGLSLGFLMVAGVLINELSLVFGVSKPLSLVPLMLVLNCFVLVGAVGAYLKSYSGKFLDFGALQLHPLAILFISLPILSVVGALWVTALGSNTVLLIMMILMSILFAIAVVSKKLVPAELYPFITLIIAISILFHSSLVSNYIVSFGSDVTGEHLIFKNTQNNAYWSSTNPYPGDMGYGRIHAMLSVTILPTVYSEILNLDSTWIYKMVFPLIFSFVPLGLYQLWKGYFGKKYAFISAFLFMAQFTFYTEMLGLNRQMIGELFFVLLLLVVLNKKLNPLGKTVCYTLFSFGLVTSHYGLSEVFLFFVAFAFISLLAFKRPSRKITAAMIASFFVIMFSWYLFTSGAAVFDSILDFSDYVHRQLGDFFDPAARGQTVMRGLGLESPPTIWNLISRAFAYATQFLIAVGFIGLLTKRVKLDLESEYFTLTFVAMAFLAVLVLVPGLANTMNMTRFYHILLFFLAPLCVVGADYIVKTVIRRRQELVISALLVIILVPYFLFQTNFVFEIVGSESWSIPLSKHRMDGYKLYRGSGYMDSISVLGGQWIRENVDFQRTYLCADLSSMHNVLTSYGNIWRGYVHVMSNTTAVLPSSIVYLSPLNTIYGIAVGRHYVYNITDLSFLSELNKIYSNGGSEIYYNNVED